MKKGCRYGRIGNTSFFICGGEQTDHVCNDRDVIYTFSDGFTGSLFDKVVEEGIYPQMCDKDKLYFLNQRDIYVIGSSVACSICGRAFANDIPWL